SNRSVSIYSLVVFSFFFSSRRRHTRSKRDWSSDVCSSDLTKRMAEDLTDFLLENGVRVQYLHSDVDTLRRIELLRSLRQGEYDEIGRASCRERVEIEVGEGVVKEKEKREE